MRYNVKALSDKRLIEQYTEAKTNLTIFRNSAKFKAWQQKALDREEIFIKKIEILEKELNARKKLGLLK